MTPPPTMELEAPNPATAPFPTVLQWTWRPPRLPRTHLELARSLLLPDGPNKGERWEPDTEPVQAVWVRQMDNPRWKTRTNVAPSQRGKSLQAIALPLLHALVECSQNAGYIMPTLDKLAQNWQSKLRPLFVGCGFGDWLPEKGPGSRGGKPAALTLVNRFTGERGGTLFFLAAGGGGKETALSSITAKLAASDEADDFASAGHLKLGEKRTESYGNDGRNIVASTVNDRKARDGHPVLEHYALGTRTRLWFQCPHCRDKGGPTAGFQVMTMEHLKYDGANADSAQTSARYVCDHCQAEWTEADRRTALLTFREVHAGQTVNAAGDVVGAEPTGDHYSLLSNDLEYNMSSLEKLAKEHWAATVAVQTRNDHSLMRLFFHKRLCEDYTGDQYLDGEAEQIDPQYLFRRSQASLWGPSVADTDREENDRTYSRHAADLPKECEFCVATIDVQMNRCYWLLKGGDRDVRTWDAAWGYEYANNDRKEMSKGDLFSVLDRIDALVREYAGGTPIVLRGVDANFLTDWVIDWLRTHHEWHPTYGASAVKASKMEHRTGDKVKDFPGIVYLRRSADWKLRQDRVHIDTTPMRLATQRGYLIKPGHAGAAHLPNGLQNNQSDKAYLQHLCAEQWVEQKMKWEKTKGGGRWDWLDLSTYGYALIRWHLERLRRDSTRPKRTVKYGNIGNLE